MRILDHVETLFFFQRVETMPACRLPATTNASLLASTASCKLPSRNFVKQGDEIVVSWQCICILLSSPSASFYKLAPYVIFVLHSLLSVE